MESRSASDILIQVLLLLYIVCVKDKNVCMFGSFACQCVIDKLFLY